MARRATGRRRSGTRRVAPRLPPPATRARPPRSESAPNLPADLGPARPPRPRAAARAARRDGRGWAREERVDQKMPGRTRPPCQSPAVPASRSRARRRSQATPTCRCRPRRVGPPSRYRHASPLRAVRRSMRILAPDRRAQELAHARQHHPSVEIMAHFSRDPRVGGRARSSPSDAACPRRRSSGDRRPTGDAPDATRRERWDRHRHAIAPPSRTSASAGRRPAA